MEKEGSRIQGSGGTLLLTKHQSNIIGNIVSNFFGNISDLAKNIFVCNGTRKFEVAVGDCTGGIVKGRKLISNPLGEPFLPQYGKFGTIGQRGKMKPNYISASSVMGALCVWVPVRYEFGHMGGSCVKIVGKPLKIFKKTMYCFCQQEPGVMLFLVPKGLLKDRK